jgi:hypothetical protein
MRDDDEKRLSYSPPQDDGSNLNVRAKWWHSPSLQSMSDEIERRTYSSLSIGCCLLFNT